jgi:hypothetical protein
VVRVLLYTTVDGAGFGYWAGSGHVHASWAAQLDSYAGWLWRSTFL